MEEAYNSLYQVGDHLIIELNSEQIFEGDYSGGSRNRIDLINTRQHNNTNELGGVYSFYRNEIIKIYQHVLKAEAKQEKTETDKDCKSIQITGEEYNRLKQMCQDAIYLNQADDKYFESVKKLGEAETIGVVALGIGACKTDVLRLLTICTWKEVYIFDLIDCRNRKFYPEIKSILESNYVTKVMHGGSSLTSLLYKCYSIYVQNIFDTQIIDLILEKSKTGSCPKNMTNISQCLIKYLNFPHSLLNDAMSVSKNKWMEKPLSEEMKFYAAQLVTYLIPLKEHMKRKLLHDVYKAIDDVHNLYFDLDYYKFSRMVQNNKVTKEIDDLIPTFFSNSESREK